MSTITGASTHTPTLIVGYESTRTARNIEHQTLGGEVSITLRKASPRSGTMVAIFEIEAEARALDADLVNPRVFVVSRDDLDEESMQFVPNGRLEVALDTEHFVWLVSIDFREVGS